MVPLISVVMSLVCMFILCTILSPYTHAKLIIRVGILRLLHLHILLRCSPSPNVLLHRLSHTQLFFCVVRAPLLHHYSPLPLRSPCPYIALRRSSSCFCSLVVLHPFLPSCLHHSSSFFILPPLYVDVPSSSSASFIHLQSLPIES